MTTMRTAATPIGESQVPLDIVFEMHVSKAGIPPRREAVSSGRKKRPREGPFPEFSTSGLEGRVVRLDVFWRSRRLLS
jgi:hypothetical protein